jgi:hypothetical protein
LLSAEALGGDHPAQPDGAVAHYGHALARPDLGGDRGVMSGAEMFAAQGRPANTARFIFLDPHSREFYPDWDKAANDTVAVLRASAGRDPYDRCLSDLVGELSTQSSEFRTRWAQHNVRQHITGIKHFHHSVVGELSLTYDRLDLVADPGLTIFIYSAEPGSRHEETLRLLGSWAATNEQPATAPGSA